MRPPLPRLRCSWPAATFAVVALADPTGATEDLPTILERAGAYVLRHAESFRYVVAEENYRQWYLGGTDAIRSRTLRSDLVFVRLPGPLPWTTFRDVFEVDGAKVRDRDRRLEKLFLRSSPRTAGEQAEEVLRESSLHNLGPFYRTINVPTLGLQFLLPGNQKRLALERRKGTRTIDGFVAVEVAFRETATPALVHDRWGNDVPARGRFFVDPYRGTVLRTEIQYDLAPERRRAGESPETAFVGTEYRREKALDTFVPAEMTELYELRGARIEARARYSNFRRFEVTMDESFGPAETLPPPRLEAPAPPPELPMIAAPPLPNEVGPLLERAGDYVARYEERFRNVAATEVCVRWAPSREGGAATTTSRSDVVFAMVAGAVPWVVFREPWPEGRAAGETGRLERLFRDSPGSAVREAAALQEEAAGRGAPGPPRTEPMLALATLRPENRDGYRFERRGHQVIDGIPTVEVAFTETAAPTLVQDTAGRSLPARGRLWVREADGAVLRSEIAFVAGTPPGDALEAVTEYRTDPGLGMLVPAVLRERISTGRPAAAQPPPSPATGAAPGPAHEPVLLPPPPAPRVETEARYGGFRRLAGP